MNTYNGRIVSTVEENGRVIYLTILTEYGKLISGKFEEDTRLTCQESSVKIPICIKDGNN